MEPFALQKDSVEYYLYQKLAQGHNSQKTSNHAVKFLDLRNSDNNSLHNSSHSTQHDSQSLHDVAIYPIEHQQKAHDMLVSYFKASLDSQIPKTTIMTQFIERGWHKSILEIAYLDALHAHAKRADASFMEVRDLLNGIEKSQNFVESHLIDTENKNTSQLLNGEGTLSAKLAKLNSQLTSPNIKSQKPKIVPIVQEKESELSYEHNDASPKNSQARINGELVENKIKIQPTQIDMTEIEDKIREQVSRQLQSHTQMQSLQSQVPLTMGAQNYAQQSQLNQQFAQELPQQFGQQVVQPIIQPYVQPIMQPIIQPMMQAGLEQSNNQTSSGRFMQNTQPMHSGQSSEKNVQSPRAAEDDLVQVSESQMTQMQELSKASSSYQKPTIIALQSSSPERIVENVNIKTSAVNVDGENVEKASSEGGGMGLYNQVVAEAIHYTENANPDRVQTGIPDLDRVISGGLKAYSTTLVSGGAGTGKSTFGLQFLVNGVLLYNQPGIYITFEQTAQSIRELGKQFGWDLENLEKQNMIVIHEYTPEQISKALETGGGSIRDMIDSVGARRIVIDSITEFRMLFHSEIAQRKALTELFKSFAKWKCTSIVIGQEHSESVGHISSVLDYECDAVILLYNERKGDIRFRSVEIYKMRETKHAGRIFPMRITANGIIINTEDRRLVRG
jgi:circadian clock protein KaiC